MPRWCRWVGVVWAQRNNDTLSSLSSPLSPLLKFAIGRGLDWAAPEVQVGCIGGAHLLVTEERGRWWGCPGWWVGSVAPRVGFGGGLGWVRDGVMGMG
jgi:hypothetical protein